MHPHRPLAERSHHDRHAAFDPRAFDVAALPEGDLPAVVGERRRTRRACVRDRPRFRPVQGTQPEIVFTAGPASLRQVGDGTGIGRDRDHAVVVGRETLALREHDFEPDVGRSRFIGRRLEEPCRHGAEYQCPGGGGDDHPERLCRCHRRWNGTRRLLRQTRIALGIEALQVDDHVGGALVALVPVLGQQLVQDPAELRIRTGRLGDPLRLTAEDARKRVVDIVAAERLSAGDHLVENAAQGEQVGALVHLFAADLLRRHVPGGAKYLSGHGHGRRHRRTGS